MSGYLVLETGSIYNGYFLVPPQGGAACGELVFNTSMTGYQEILTDPSYCGQIILLTYPLIGNYGIFDNFEQSCKISASGLIVKEAFLDADEDRDKITSYLRDKNIPLFTGVDTRKLTREIREKGTVKAFFLTEDVYSEVSDKKMLFKYCIENVKPSVKPGSEVQHVSTKKILQIDGLSDRHIVVVDYGCKNGIIKSLTKRGCSVTVVPYDAGYETIMSFKPGGVLLSNGPGDPKDVIEQTKAIKNLIGKLPIMGVCLGHQLLALHMGGDTYKLKYGHRGANHPAQDVRTGKVWITSQNHGYSVSKDNIPEGMAITHINLNDNTVEGMRHLKYPILSVQFHPEGSPGPKDSEEIFDEFLKLVYVYGKGEYHEKRIS
jgi:carbamoyl-phosphate synthase, small subunit